MKRQLPLALVFLFGVFMIFQYFVPHEKSEYVYEFLLDWIYIIGIFALALGIWSLFRVSVERIKLRKEGATYSYVALIGLYLMIAFGFTAGTGDGGGLSTSYYIWLLLGVVCLALVMRARAETVSGRKKQVALGALVSLIGFVLMSIFDNTWAYHFYTPEGLSNPMFRIFFDYVMMPILATMFALLAFFIASAAYRAFRARNLLATLLLLANLVGACQRFLGQGRDSGNQGFILGSWLPVPLGFASLANQLIDRNDGRLHVLVAKDHGTEHHLFGQLLCLGLHHQHR